MIFLNFFKIYLIFWGRMKKLINAILSFTLQNGLRYVLCAYVLVFSLSIIFNQGHLLSTDPPMEVINLIDLDAETEEENTEDEKTLNDLFFARNKASNELLNVALLRAHIHYSLIALFLEIILPPPEV